MQCVLCRVRMCLIGMSLGSILFQLCVCFVSYCEPVSIAFSLCSVDIASNKRLRKLRRSENETTLSGAVYKQRLRSQ